MPRESGIGKCGHAHGSISRSDVAQRIAGVGGKNLVLVSNGDTLCRVLMVLICMVSVLALATGCDRLARHKVLTFFFTGVPSIEEQDRMKEAAREMAKGPKTVADAQTATKKKKSSAIPPSREFAHGPFAASACFLCHETSVRGGALSAGNTAGSKSSEPSRSIVPGNYVVPLQELCASCHESKSPQRANASGLWVHGPVGNGYCIMCHSPHASREPYMLLKDADALCAGCHGEGEILTRTLHKDRRDCISCHNPHVGKDSRLLKADYLESW